MNSKQILLKTALAGTLALSSINCKLPYEYYLDYFYSPKKVSEINLTSDLESKLFELNTIDEVIELVYDNIEYDISEPYGWRWQPPQETLDLRKGDCEDFSLLTMKLLNIRFGIKPDLIEFVIYGINQHFVIRDNGIYYDSTLGREVDISYHKITLELSYDEAFRQLSEYLKEENDLDNEPIYYKSISDG